MILPIPQSVVRLYCGNLRFEGRVVDITEGSVVLSLAEIIADDESVAASIGTLYINIESIDAWAEVDE